MWRWLPLLAACAPAVGADCPEPEPVVETTSFDGGLAPRPLEDWVGSWTGVCKVLGFDDVGTTLVIGDDERGLSWDLTYEGQATRAYTLVPTDDPARWVLDENNNGLLVDHFVAGDQMIGLFTISGQHIVFNWLRSGDRMDVLMPGFAADAPRQTSLGELQLDAFASSSFQRCTLFR
jgi:hypothetical protein